MALSKSAAVATAVLRHDEPVTLDELERLTLEELDVDVGRRTVQRVVGELEDEDLLERVDRGGPYPAEYHRVDGAPTESSRTPSTSSSDQEDVASDDVDEDVTVHPEHSGGSREDLLDELDELLDRILEQEPEHIEIGSTKVNGRGQAYMGKPYKAQQYDRVRLRDDVVVYRRTD